MAEDGKKQNGSYHEVPLAEIVNGDVGEHAPTEETKEQGRENAQSTLAICNFKLQIHNLD